MFRLREKFLLNSLFSFSLLFSSSLSALEYGTGISEEELTRLVSDYKKDPGALAFNQHKLKNLTAKQIKMLVEALKLSHFEYIYPVDIKGKEIPELLGKAFKDYSLMAVRAGKMIPIPFQFDEYDTTGLIYISGYSPYKIQGTEGLMDSDDSLVFMYRDSGEVKYDPKSMNTIEGKIVKELEFNSSKGSHRYIYLVKGNPDRSKADYVSANMEEGILESPVYRAEYNPDNIIELRNVFPKAGPRYGQNLIDNLYINISTGIFSQNLRVGLNSRDNIRAIPLAIKDGPVRINILLKARIQYMGVPVFKDYLNVTLYEQAFNIPSRFSLDSLNAIKYFVLFLKEPRAHLALDLTGLDGSEILFDSINERGSAIIDGKMSPGEHAINKARLPGDWIWLDSHSGWSFFFSNNLAVFPEGVFDYFLQGMMISILYEDDKSLKTRWERYPGAEPRIGADTEGLPGILLNMIFAMRSLDFSEIESLGDMIYFMIELAEKGQLDKLDRIIQATMDKMINEGKFNNSKEFAELYMKDIKLINFKGAENGAEKEKLNRVFYETFRATEDIHHMTILEGFTNLVRLANKHGIDLKKIEYATQDNTLWFPVTVGDDGPASFQKDVKNPPLYVIKKFTAE